MSEGDKILVELAGQQFRIVPPGGNAERLRRAAEYVDKKIRGIESAGVVASHRSALLAALEITLELFQNREEGGQVSDADLREAHSKLDQVLGRLDDALASNP